MGAGGTTSGEIEAEGVDAMRAGEFVPINDSAGLPEAFHLIP